jgi:hypothetical protein
MILPLRRLASLIIVPLFLSSNATAELIPQFIVLNENTDRQAALKNLTELGGKIKIEALPVIVGDFPSDVSVGNQPFVKSLYKSAVAIASLEGYGPMAVAAGINWNRSLAGTAQKQSGSMGAMSSQISKLSLLPPTELSGVVIAEKIKFSWKPIVGTILYHLQYSDKSNFSTILYETRTDKITIAAPRLRNGTLHARVRALDKQDIENTSVEWTGKWSAAIQIDSPTLNFIEDRPIPMLTSPADQLETSGMTVVLEWMTQNDAPARIQISDTADFQSLIVDEIPTVAEFAAAPSLFKIGQTYFWRAQIWNTQNSAWSTPRRFIIGQPVHAELDGFINPEAPR